MEKIKFKMTTKSNLCIGGVPKMFEIGGVDMETVTDYNGQPIIPASSLKGVLRRIIKEMDSQEETAKAIAEAYQKYLKKLKEETLKLLASGEYKLEQERISAMEKRFNYEITNASTEHLFGIQGFNDTPKLIFHDLKLKNAVKDWYSLDSKNKIEFIKKNTVANPRTYKTVRPGITFCGEIILHRMELLQVNGVAEFIKRALMHFNDGIYRLGNSGSRGYGYVEVKFDEE